MLSSVLSLQWSGFCFRRVRRKDSHGRLFAVQSEASAGYGGVEMVPLSERDCRTKFLASEIFRSGRARLATDNQLTGVQSPPAWVWLGTRTRVPLVARRD